MVLRVGAVVLLLACWASSAEIYDGLVNRNVERSIDLSSQFAKHTIDVTIVNSGSAPASSYFLAIRRPDFLEVLSNGQRLKATFVENAAEGDISYELYNVEFAAPLSPQDSVDIQVRAVYSHALEPFPAAIAQQEKQLVRYSDNHYFFSPYSTETQETKVKLASTTVERKSELGKTSLKGDTLTYGPYADVAARSVSPLSVHFENNKPFVTVSKLVKEIEISHWGNVAVEETYTLQHDGAKLKGAFSRFDYQRNPAASVNCISGLRTFLPSGAADVYYRDEIGNISTSHLVPEEGPRGVELQLAPRFPLFGGWKIGFYLGYNLPLTKYLLRSTEESNRYVLNITFGSGFEDVVVDELVVRIIFPEGSKKFEVAAPFGIDSQSTGWHYTYLDTAGRPVLILTKKNVVPEHDQFFQVAYTFSQLSMLQEPLLLIAAFFLLFLAVMVYVRIDITIGAPKAAGSEAVARVVDEVRDVLERRQELHEQLDAVLERAIQKRSVGMYESERKPLETKFAKLAADFTRLISEAEPLSKDVALKLREIEKKQKAKATSHDALHRLELSKAITRAISKADYESQKATHEQHVLDADDDSASLLADLE